MKESIKNNKLLYQYFVTPYDEIPFDIKGEMKEGKNVKPESNNINQAMTDKISGGPISKATVQQYQDREKNFFKDFTDSRGRTYDQMTADKDRQHFCQEYFTQSGTQNGTIISVGNDEEKQKLFLSILFFDKGFINFSFPEFQKKYADKNGKNGQPKKTVQYYEKSKEINFTREGSYKEIRDFFNGEGSSIVTQQLSRIFNTRISNIKLDNIKTKTTKTGKKSYDENSLKLLAREIINIQDNKNPEQKHEVFFSSEGKGIRVESSQKDKNVPVGRSGDNADQITDWFFNVIKQYIDKEEAGGQVILKSGSLQLNFSDLQYIKMLRSSSSRSYVSLIRQRLLAIDSTSNFTGTFLGETSLLLNPNANAKTLGQSFAYEKTKGYSRSTGESYSDAVNEDKKIGYNIKNYIQGAFDITLLHEGKEYELVDLQRYQNKNDLDKIYYEAVNAYLFDEYTSQNLSSTKTNILNFLTGRITNYIRISSPDTLGTFFLDEQFYNQKNLFFLINSYYIPSSVVLEYFRTKIKEYAKPIFSIEMKSGFDEYDNYSYKDFPYYNEDIPQEVNEKEYKISNLMNQSFFDGIYIKVMNDIKVEKDWVNSF